MAATSIKAGDIVRLVDPHSFSLQDYEYKVIRKSTNRSYNSRRSRFRHILAEPEFVEIDTQGQAVESGKLIIGISQVVRTNTKLYKLRNRLIYGTEANTDGLADSDEGQSLGTSPHPDEQHQETQ